MAKRDVVRRDNKNRILRVGESQRKDGKYMFKYYVGGTPYFLTSWRLLPSDRQPKGTKPTLSLRELEKQIGRDFDAGLNRNLQNMTVRELVDRYLATKINVKPNTRVNYNSSMLSRYFSNLGLMMRYLLPFLIAKTPRLSAARCCNFLMPMPKYDPASLIVSVYLSIISLLYITLMATVLSMLVAVRNKTLTAVLACDEVIRLTLY